MHQPDLVFITGTDTGVGKTLLAAMLLQHLRRNGCNALAMKPFCSGGRGDARLLNRLQFQALSMDDMNPFCFQEPLAPGVAARIEGRTIRLAEAKARILAARSRCARLLVEGAGGLLAPLGEGFTLLDLVQELGGQVVVVGPNRLGVINHVLLTVQLLQIKGIKRIKAVLMGQRREDRSAESNPQVLAEILWPVRVYTIPYLGEKALQSGAIERTAKKIKKTLALIFGINDLSDTATVEEAGGRTKLKKVKKTKKSFDSFGGDCRFTALLD